MPSSFIRIGVLVYVEGTELTTQGKHLVTLVQGPINDVTDTISSDRFQAGQRRHNGKGSLKILHRRILDLAISLEVENGIMLFFVDLLRLNKCHIFISRRERLKQVIKEVNTISLPPKATPWHFCYQPLHTAWVLQLDAWEYICCKI